MVEIKCSTKDTIKLTDCVAFQGNLKKRTQQNIDELKQSLSTEGLLMPFAVWVHDNKSYLLDGHGRKEALVQLAVDDPSLLTVDWPCVFITAETEDDAKKALLQITSSYGRITKQGVKQFTVSIPEYHAPAISRFIPKEHSIAKVKAEATGTGKKIIRLRVPEAMLQELLNGLKQFKFIEVL